MAEIVKARQNQIDDNDLLKQGVEHEIKQDAQNNASQVNVSKKGCAIAVGLEGSAAVVTQEVDQLNSASQEIIQDQPFALNVNAALEALDLQNLLMSVPSVSAKVKYDEEGNLFVNGKKYDAKDVNMIVIGQKQHSENNTTEETK